MATTEHYVELDRLWRAVKRDVFFQAELSFRGLDDAAQARCHRMYRNWQKLCDLDLDVADRLAHGLEDVAGVLSSGRVLEHRWPGLRERSGMERIAREVDPDIEERHRAELVALAEDAIRREIDDEVG